MSCTSIPRAAVLLLVATATSAAASASSPPITTTKHNLRGLLNYSPDDSEGGDIVLDYEPYDEIENDAGISRIEYMNLLTFRNAIIDFWTPENIMAAIPHHLTLDVNPPWGIEMQQRNNDTADVVAEGGGGDLVFDEGGDLVIEDSG